MAGVTSFITFLLVATALLQMAMSCVANAILWFTIWQKLAHLSRGFPVGLVPRHYPSQIPKSVNAQFSSVQSLSHVRLFATPWTAAHQASLSSTNFRSLLRLMSIKSVMPSNHLILCHPFLLLSSIFQASGSFPVSQFFASGGQKYWSFSFIISPSNEYPGLISFRMDWLDLLEVQGTLKSLLHYYCSKALILRVVFV